MEGQEDIRRRLLRLAARHWGYQESEMDLEAFDPFVNLMVTALSGELARLERQLEDSESRILEQMLEQLSPELLTGARPAHAIATARGLKPIVDIGLSSQLYTTKDDGREEVDVYLTPLSDYVIYDGAIRFLEIGGREIFSLNEKGKRESVVKAQHSQSDSINELWIGLDLNTKIEDISGLRFFFNWVNAPDIDETLHWLKLARWSVGEYQISNQSGLREVQSDGAFKDGEVQSFIQQEYSRYHRLKREVHAHYEDHFVTLKDAIDTQGNRLESLSALKCFYPKDFEQSYELDQLAVFDQKLLWIKVQFPTQFKIELLLETVCSFNAFPVVNLRFLEEKADLRDQLNIIALPTNNHYFDLLKAVNAKGAVYHEVPLTNIRNYASGQYSLRQGHIGKMNNRAAGTALLDMLDFIRDESAAFSAYGKDQLRSRLVSLNQQIKSLEQQIYERGGSGTQLNFIAVKPYESDRRVTVTYLSTNGEVGNGLIGGQSLEAVRFPHVQRKSLVLLTTSTGGKEPLSRLDRKYAYKKAIISRGRVVTKEDIRAYCEAKLGENLKSVLVRKAYQSGLGPKNGVHQIISVELVLDDDNLSLDSRVMGLKLQELQEELNSHSSGALPIVVKSVLADHRELKQVRS